MSVDLPHRGDGSERPSGLVLPPQRMALIHDARPLKRWRYVGIYGEDLLLCCGAVRVCGLPQSFWAVWDRRTRRLHEHTTSSPRAPVRLPDGGVRVRDRRVEIDLRVEPDGEPVEVTSPHGRSHIWTRKLPVRAVGTVRIDGRQHRVRAAGLLDDSAGYHARRTEWEWCAGVGTASDGAALCWNFVRGVHDVGAHTENTVWHAGRPAQTGRVEVSEHLDHVGSRDGGDLRFTAEAIRTHDGGLGPLIHSTYEQPFGLFSGTLPGRIALAEGFGVMERHSARW